MEILILLAAWFIVGSKTIGNVVRDGRLASSGQMPPRYQLQMERLKAGTSDPREAGRVIRKRGAFGTYVATVAADAWTDLLTGHQRKEREYRAEQAAKEQAKAAGTYQPTAREKYLDEVRDTWRNRKDRAFDRLAERRRRKNEARRHRETQPEQQPEQEHGRRDPADNAEAPAVARRDSTHDLDGNPQPEKTDPAIGQNASTEGQDGPENDEPAPAGTEEPGSDPGPQNGVQRDGVNGHRPERPSDDVFDQFDEALQEIKQAARSKSQPASQNDAAEAAEPTEKEGAAAGPDPKQANAPHTNDQQSLGGDALMGANTQNINGEVHSQQSAAQLSGAWANTLTDISSRLEQAMTAQQANGVENVAPYVVAMEHVQAAAAALAERAETLQSKGQVVTEAFAQGGGDVGDNRDWHQQN